MSGHTESGGEGRIPADLLRSGNGGEEQFIRFINLKLCTIILSDLSFYLVTLVGCWF